MFITKEEYDKLPAHVQALYDAKGDGFEFKPERVEDNGALKRAKDREVQEKKELQAKFDEVSKRIKEIEDAKKNESNEDARKKGDIATLEKSWQEKMNNQEKEFSGKLSRYEKMIIDGERDRALTQVLSETTDYPNLLKPHVMSRISIDLDGDKPTVRVLDAEGKISAGTLADLKKEVASNKEFSAIIRASKASGSGTTKSDAPTRNGASQQQQPTDLSKLNPKDLAEHIKAKREASGNEGN